ncbi:MAG TPA: hypothetical protein VFD58_07960 [Blastocatellia bacterium]|nr:hypothetical protein [Blastocatellia bacterium]
MNQKILNVTFIVVILLLAGAVGYLLLNNKAATPKAEQHPIVTNNLTNSTPVASTTNKATTQQSSQIKSSGEEIKQTSTGYNYNNYTYSFSLSFPSSWEGLATKARTSVSDKSIIYLDFEVPASKCSTTPNPKTGACYNTFAAIGIIPVAKWDSIKNDPGQGAELGSNSKYVFVWVPSQESPENTQSATQIAATLNGVAASFKILNH